MLFKFMQDEGSKPICPIMSGQDFNIHCVRERCPIWRWAEPMRRTFAGCRNRTATEAGECGTDSPGEDWTFTPYNESTDANAHWVQSEKCANKARLGYCGLGGKPEIFE